MVFAEFITHPLARGHQGRPRHAQARQGHPPPPPAHRPRRALRTHCYPPLELSSQGLPPPPLPVVTTGSAALERTLPSSLHQCTLHAAHSCRAGVRANAGPGVLQAADRHLHQAHHHARQVQAAREGARALPVHYRGGMRAQPRVLRGPCLHVQQERPLRRGVRLA
jgi:hypothetical protein